MARRVGMAGNTFGRLLRLTTFGESHGQALGGILDGCPPGISIDADYIQADLDRRRPGAGTSATKRKEADKIQLLSGIYQGVTTGTPIGFIIANEDQRSRDYGNLAEIFRPGHADWTYFCKYNGIRDHRGGGRASGRETACRVAGGAIAKKILETLCGGRILAACVELGGLGVPENEMELENAHARPYFAASGAIVEKWDGIVEEARKAGDTLGGIARVVAQNIPAGLGEPVFDKLDAMLAYALMSIGAVKAVEIGLGKEAARLQGSINNDAMHPGKPPFRDGMPNPEFAGNNAGGILGGISTGQDIVAQAAFKPIASIAKPQLTIDKYGNEVTIQIGGRHDLSAIPRAVPVMAAMTALTLADALLMQRRMAGRP